MQPDEIQRSISDFSNAGRSEQKEMLEGTLQAAPADVVRDALTSPDVKANVGPIIFPGVPEAARADLYRTILWILAALALIALIGGGVALVAGKESAAFFTFAGLALGGITGILVPSPAGSGSGG